MSPIMDPVKLKIAQDKRLRYKICRSCGKRNSINAIKCRKCRGKNLRLKRFQRKR